MVEHWVEGPGVGNSKLPLGTKKKVVYMIREGKHYCDKKDCGIELPWAPGSFHKFYFEYQVSPNRNGFIFKLELCTECEEELVGIVSSLMNKYLVLPETKYPTTMRA